jgi:hypothetical protein
MPENLQANGKNRHLPPYSGMKKFTVVKACYLTPYKISWTLDFEPVCFPQFAAHCQ